ncbi:ARF GTPase-activating GIT1 isoform X3 [Labeo rohita]|uniref:ARF GTPase-activating GIT1 isoform X3 n=1 Tax=Labeo rohita TaxID=84645 RepID=A0A498LQL3_LABRO|nr:ARF GTPase-activating GIT1 isoform X3 [Labeo rohita]
MVSVSEDPGWSSINRGVLICDECCSVHRSLGRHISIVKHLRHSGWPPSLLQMVQTLASNGANSIWEHSLLDPAQVQSGRRKPNPQDKVHPTKSEFIRAKYQMLAFVHKLPCRDDDGVTTKDLSKEKGTTPLHVAAKAGQVLQAELLVVYGADPGAPDINGRTPIDYARQAGHVELAERLVECQYELTDRLAFYLCGRRPDHKNGHYIIPQMADSLDLSELAKAAKKKLQALNNRLFEELAMDVYDEVDRRENDAVWLTTQNHSTLVTERSAVPFLPVNPEYSATRNQGRQKLARFNAREFATLIIDILSDAKRRQHGKGLTSPTDPLDLSQADDDQHDYDSVASDEDTDSELTAQNNNNTQRNNRAKSMDSSDLSDGPITLQEYLEVKKALASSEAKVQQLMKVNNNLSEELRRLQKEVRKGAPAGPTPYGGPHLSASTDGRYNLPKAGEKYGSGTDSDYDNSQTYDVSLGVGRSSEEDSRGDMEDTEGEPDPTLPCTEDVILKTEQVTKNIQELLRAAQEFKHDSFVPCSEKIHLAVTEMASLFPKRPALDAVRSSLKLLAASASRLQVECRKAAPSDSSASTVDYQLLTQQVIQCAYDIAKAAKQLVTITTREKKQ